MQKYQLEKILDDCLSHPENEVIEFKEAKNDYDFEKIGKYFSAISNEANLRNIPYGWLIFGIQDKNHTIIGSNYRNNSQRLDNLKGELARQTTNQITFIAIYEIFRDDKRILLFQIPACPMGIPTAFQGHYYARNGEEITPLSIEKLERIRRQIDIDWSAAIVEGASIDDLDEDAIALARRNYKNKFPDKAEELETWDDITFLNKAKITIKNKITHTALILLGKNEAEHFLSPADIKIRWKLVEKGQDVDYEIFGIPFLLTVDKVFSKIRNIKYRYMQEGSIFPMEVSKYEPYAIREAINNCIAHQDYTKNARINIVEKEDELIFSNYGQFIPESIEKVVLDDSPEEFYRNRFLATAMFNLKMVDTAGGGIRKIFNYQKERFFPLPEYDISNEKVSLTLTGKILNSEYANLLAHTKTLTLKDVIALDKVQKRKSLTEEEEKSLKSKKLIEGRKPNYFISKIIAQKIGQKATYSKNKGFENEYYKDLLLKALEEHGAMSRKEIDELLQDKLPDIMDIAQKNNRIRNLLTHLRSQNIIENTGSQKKPLWQLK